VVPAASTMGMWKYRAMVASERSFLEGMVGGVDERTDDSLLSLNARNRFPGVVKLNGAPIRTPAQG